MVISLLLFAYSWYGSYKFDNNPLSKNIRQQIAKKEFEIKILIKKHYKIDIDIPIIVTDKMNSKLFGMATFDTSTNKIKIYLNKKRFKESLRYMLDDVLPHEYAHALMFSFKYFSNENSGHTKKWQKACINLNGIKCNRFVDHNDIVINKTKLLY